MIELGSLKIHTLCPISSSSGETKYSSCCSFEFSRSLFRLWRHSKSLLSVPLFEVGSECPTFNEILLLPVALVKVYGKTNVFQNLIALHPILGQAETLLLIIQIYFSTFVSINLRGCLFIAHLWDLIVTLNACSRNSCSTFVVYYLL